MGQKNNDLPTIAVSLLMGLDWLVHRRRYNGFGRVWSTDVGDVSWLVPTAGF